MTQKDHNRISMMTATQQFLEQTKTIWSNNRPFSKNVESLSAVIAAVQTVSESPNALSADATYEKYALEEKALDAVVAIAKSAKSYALDMEDAEMRTAVSFPRSTLDALPEDDQIARMRSIVEMAQAKAKDLSEYGVEDFHFSAANEAIDTYANMLPNPGDVIAARTVHTDSIAGIMKQGRQVLERLDNLVHIFDEASSYFSSGYEAARVVVDAGGRREVLGAKGE